MKPVEHRRARQGDQIIVAVEQLGAAEHGVAARA
jgi:hypothetical protein